METNVNPYAPPLGSQDSHAVEIPEILQARFVVNELWRKKIAYDFLMPGAILLFSSLMMLLVGLFVGALIAPMHAGWPVAVMIGFPLGAIGAILFHIVAHQWLLYQNLRRLRSHPVLRADGDWLMELDQTELRLKTDGGIARWPLADVAWHFTHGELVLLQLPGKIAIGIPPAAELTPSRPKIFRNAVRARVRRWPMFE